MLDWLRENAELLSALGSIGMLVIWLAYLQLFYVSLRNQRRPKLLIHQAGGLGLDDRCIVANMSPATVYVAAVLVDVQSGDERITFMPKTPKAKDDTLDHPLELTRQGPLRSGSYLDLGTFDSLLGTGGERVHARAGEDGTVITIRVAGLIGAELFPAAASRTFKVADDGANGTLVEPLSVLPTELSWREQRRVARAWLKESQRADLARIDTPQDVPA